MQKVDTKVLEKAFFDQKYVKRGLGGPRMEGKRAMRAPKGLPGDTPGDPRGPGADYWRGGNYRTTSVGGW